MKEPNTELHRAKPANAARLLLASEPNNDWLDSFMHQLTTLRTSTQLATVLEVWGLSQAEFAELMGVSRQAISKWIDRLPAERHVTVATLAAATDLLVHYVRRERIPAVVRRPAPGLNNQSLLDLVAQDRVAEVLVATRAMFDPAGAMA